MNPVNVKIQIPKGWRKIRIGANYLDGDLYLESSIAGLSWRDAPAHWTGNYIAPGMLVIRRIKK